MKDKNRVVKVVIKKMMNYCGNIAELMGTFDNSYENYVSNIAFQYSCNMCVLQIGELTTRLPEEFKEQHNKIPWRKIKALRNIHAHEYEELDFTIMWEILQTDIPKLLLSLQEIWDKLEDEKKK